MKEILLNKLAQVQKIAEYSKIKRFLNNPKRYAEAILLRKLIYPITQKEKIATVNLFFDQSMDIALPASTDIYLTGGKSHTSEINLARFLIINLDNGNDFIDIGAHYGYFSLLASELIGSNGRILSFEPGKSTYELLQTNTAHHQNISIHNKAVSNVNGIISFYEFPSMYSEYNSADVAQFENENWYGSATPQKVEVDSITIDQMISDHNFDPAVIKMDVEGGEFDVIQGALTYLKEHNPFVVMEYLASERQNANHKKASELLKSFGYKSHSIDNDGHISIIDDIDSFLAHKKIDSDNIVFKK